MGGKNRHAGGSRGSNKGKSKTTAKVLNKKKNKDNRSKFNEERKAKVNAKLRATSTSASAEHGFTVRSNARAAKKAQRRQATKAERLRKREMEAERNAPVRPEDVVSVLAGLRKAKSISDRNISAAEARSKEAKALRKQGVRAPRKELYSSSAMRDGEEDEDDEEEDDSEMDSDLGSDDDDDAEEEEEGSDDVGDDDVDDDDDDGGMDSEEEEERRAAKAAAKEKQQRQAEKKAARREKGIFLTPKAAAQLKAKGVDPKQWLAEKVAAKAARKQAHDEMERARRKERERKWEKKQGYDDDDDDDADKDAEEDGEDESSSEEDEPTDEEEAQQRYEAFFANQNEDALLNAPVLEKVKQRRAKEQARLRREQFEAEKARLEAIDNGEAEEDDEAEEEGEEEEEEEEEDAEIDEAGPDSEDVDDDDDDVAAASGGAKRKYPFDVPSSNGKGGRKGAAAGTAAGAAAAAGGAEAGDIEQSTSAKRRMAVSMAANARKKSLLPVRMEDGSWVMRASEGDDVDGDVADEDPAGAEDGEAVDGEGGADGGERGAKRTRLLNGKDGKGSGTRGGKGAKDDGDVEVDGLDKYRRKPKEPKQGKAVSAASALDDEEAGAAASAMTDGVEEPKHLQGTYTLSSGAVLKGSLGLALRDLMGAASHSELHGKKGKGKGKAAEGEESKGEDGETEADASDDDTGKRGGKKGKKAAGKRALAAAPAKPVQLSPAELKAARRERLTKVQLVLAELCEEVLSSPDKFVVSGHLTALLDVCKDHDKTVRQLASVSLTQVLVDLIPAYRIRIPSKEELQKESALGKMLSREVIQTRRYERTLLDAYTKHVKQLKKQVAAVIARATGSSEHQSQREDAFKGAPTVALGCLCRLFERAYSFNLSKEIASFLASILTSRFETFRDTVAACVRTVFQADIAGDATLEIVRAIAHVFKTKGGDRVRAPLLEVLLHLPLSREILSSKDVSRKVGGGSLRENQAVAKWKKVGGAGNHALNLQKAAALAKDRERKGKPVKKGAAGAAGAAAAGSAWVSKTNKPVSQAELKRDMAEGDAEVAVDHRKRTQTAVLSLVCTIYFRYLKQAPTLKTLFVKADAGAESGVRIGFSAESAKAKGVATAATAAGASATSASSASAGAGSAAGASTSASTAGATIRGQAVTLGPRTGVPPPPPPPPSQLVLKAVLDGLRVYAHLINLELLLDLLEHIKLVVGASAHALSMASAAQLQQQGEMAAGVGPGSAAAAAAASAGLPSPSSSSGSGSARTPQEAASEARVLPLRSALMCIHTACTLMKMHNNAISIDLTAFYRHFYEILWQLMLPEELPHLPLALDCFELLVLGQRSVSPGRVAAICRRMMIVGALLKPNIALPIIHAVGRAFVKHPRVTVLLENEGAHSGVYDPTMADPDLSQGLASPAWDLTLFRTSYHPFANKVLAHATSLPQMLQYQQGSAAAAAAAKQAAAEADARRQEGGGAGDKGDEDGSIAAARSSITIPLAGEKVVLSRLDANQLLRVLDATRGAFVPEIEEPSLQSIAITSPSAVTSSTLKQAIGRARNNRVAADARGVDADSLLPAAWKRASTGYAQAASALVHPGGGQGNGAAANQTVVHGTGESVFDAEDSFAAALRERMAATRLHVVRKLQGAFHHSQ